MQIIDDFAAYNSEGFMSTLELLPMWQNVDPDVDLFGSGVVSELSEEASEWAAGHPLKLDGPCAWLLSKCFLVRLGIRKCACIAGHVGGSKC